MTMDILTLDRAQMTHEGRQSLITRGGEEIERRVKPERINQTIDCHSGQISVTLALYSEGELE